MLFLLAPVVVSDLVLGAVFIAAGKGAEAMAKEKEDKNNVSGNSHGRVDISSKDEIDKAKPDASNNIDNGKERE